MIELRKAQNHILISWAIGIIPLFVWLFLSIFECEDCYWTPLSYAAPPLTMMVLVFFNRAQASRKISRDVYRLTLILSIAFLVVISGALLFSTVSSDPLVPEKSILRLFSRFDELLTFILGLAMAGLGVIFSGKEGQPSDE